MQNPQEAQEEEYFEIPFNRDEYNRWEAIREKQKEQAKQKKERKEKRLPEDPELNKEIFYAPFGVHQGEPIPGVASPDQLWPGAAGVMSTCGRDRRFGSHLGVDWKEEPGEGRALSVGQEARIDDDRFGNIDFIRSLGKGKFGEVWEVIAEWRPSAETEVFEKRKYACKITKSGIMRIPDSATGFPYSVNLLFLELCSGTLNELLKFTPEEGPQKSLERKFSEKMSRHWFAQIARALEYIHSQGVTHEDLHVNNVLYLKNCSEETPFEDMFMSCTFKLTDFGISMVNHIPEADFERGKEFDLQQLHLVLIETGLPFKDGLPDWKSLSYAMYELCRWLEKDEPGTTAETIRRHKWLQNNKDPRTEPFIKRYGQEELSGTFLSDFFNSG